MMGREYFTVAGYTTDGAVVCRKCGEAANLPAAQQITESQANSDFSEDGLYCGTCGTVIVGQDLFCENCGEGLDGNEVDGLCDSCSNLDVDEDSEKLED